MSFTTMKNALFTIVGISMLAGCTTISNTPINVQKTEVSRGRDRIACVSDLENIDKKQVMYLTIPMNDQSYQPFRDLGDHNNRLLYPMWTDIDLIVMDRTDASTRDFVVTNWMVNLTTFNIFTSTNYSGVSVEIPAVYRGTPDSRWNLRMDYTKYTSIGQFLFMNAEADVYENFNDAKTAWNNIINHPSVETGSLEDKILYAPRFFVIKIDCSKIDPDRNWAHSKNPNLQIMYNRSIAGKRFEMDPNDLDGTRKIWTPIMPRWSSGPMFVNSFITGDLANPTEQ